jgi:hypothetical protein
MVWCTGSLGPGMPSKSPSFALVGFCAFWCQPCFVPIWHATVYSVVTIHYATGSIIVRTDSDFILVDGSSWYYFAPAGNPRDTVYDGGTGYGHHYKFTLNSDTLDANTYNGEIWYGSAGNFAGYSITHIV